MLKSGINGGNKHNSDSLLESALQSIEAAKEALKDNIAEVQKEIEAVQQRRNELENGPISFEDYCALLRKSIWWRGHQFARKHVLVGRDGRHPDGRRPWHECSGQALAFDAILNLAPSAEALCFYFPEVIYARLVETLQAEYGAKWAKPELVPFAEREVLIARFDEQLAELRRQKDALGVRLHEMSRAAAPY